jgi:septum formation protein
MSEDLILASASPRRQAFVRALGLTVAVDAADIDETPVPSEMPEELVARLCSLKASTVARRWPVDATVLAADTIVVLDGAVLGKPADSAGAVEMLQRLRSKPHQVITAVAVVRGTRSLSECCHSTVWMRNYSDDEIAGYVATGDPLDKAGSYAIQHARFAPAARWEGCYSSIMGLPLALTLRLLHEVGLQAPHPAELVCQAVGAPCCAPEFERGRLR